MGSMQLSEFHAFIHLWERRRQPTVSLRGLSVHAPPSDNHCSVPTDRRSTLLRTRFRRKYTVNNVWRPAFLLNVPARTIRVFAPRRSLLSRGGAVSHHAGWSFLPRRDPWVVSALGSEAMPPVLHCMWLSALISVGVSWDRTFSVVERNSVNLVG